MIKKILLIILLSLSSLMAKEDIIKLKERSYIITIKLPIAEAMGFCF